jgi:nitroimidazol reductase NimA-like FMN-containing flavoprotein (pyridoxamine 5'-phosphate oxidase superfamily)
MLPPEANSRLVDILSRPHLARLATAAPENMQPHVVPVWFLWDGESLWISAFASTRKVKEVARNQRISVVVDGGGPPEDVPGWGVLMEGIAELISSPVEFVAEMSTHIYTRYLGLEGVLEAEPQSWIHDEENRLIRLKPDFIHIW